MIRRVLLLSIVCFLVNTVSHAQNSGNSILENARIDPELRYGKLPNGFTYYIRDNNNSTEIAMSLVVKAGLYQEDDDQIELAHLMEHMVFIGTNHFPNAFDFFQQKGLEKGDGIYAQTSGHEVTYDLLIPSGNLFLLKSGLQFLRDCADGILLDSNKIESERNVMIEENRMRSTGIQRMLYEKYAKTISRDTKSEFPTSEEIRKNLKTFTHSSLFRFYHDWYRADLQAIVIVGDLNLDSMENEIKPFFETLKAPVSPRPLKTNIAFQATKNQFLTASDKNTHETKVKIIAKYPSPQPHSIEYYRGFLIQELYNEMIRNRLLRVAEVDQPAFISASSDFRQIAPYGIYRYVFSALSTDITCIPGTAKEGVQAVMGELERVKRYGFDDDELKYAKEYVYRSLLDSVTSKSILRDYIDYFVNNSTLLNPSRKPEMMRLLLEKLTLQEVNKTTREWISETNRDIMIIAPEDQMGEISDESTVRKWLAEVSKLNYKPYQLKNLVSKPLLSHRQLSNLKEKKVMSKSVISEIGVTQLDLKNGVRVFLKPIKGNNSDPHQIYISAFRSGGTSSYSQEDYFSALFASAIASYNGLGPFNDFELKKYLSSKRLTFFHKMLARSEGLEANLKKEDMETALQLIYLYFTNPKTHKEGFERFKKNIIREIEGRSDDPVNILFDSISIITYRDFPTTADQLNKLNFNKVLSIYKDRFTNANGFSFVVTGDFKPEEFIPLIAKYLGNLPSVIRKANSRTSKNIDPRPQKNTKYVFAGTDSGIARVELRFQGAFEATPENALKLDVLCKALMHSLTWRLREMAGGTYHVAVGNVNSFKSSMINDREFSGYITFECASANADSLLKYALQEINNLRDNGPDENTFKLAIGAAKNGLIREVQSKRFWLDYIESQTLNERSLLEINEREALIDNLKPGDLKAAARNYLDENNLMKFVLMPENYKLKDKK